MESNFDRCNANTIDRQKRRQREVGRKEDRESGMNGTRAGKVAEVGAGTEMGRKTSFFYI